MSVYPFFQSNLVERFPESNKRQRVIPSLQGRLRSNALTIQQRNPGLLALKDLN